MYLTEEQRRLIDEIAQAEGVTLAEVIRRALDAYLDTERDPTPALAASFGADPHAHTPSRDEWWLTSWSTPTSSSTIYGAPSN